VQDRRQGKGSAKGHELGSRVPERTKTPSPPPASHHLVILPKVVSDFPFSLQKGAHKKKCNSDSGQRQSK
jgi:hypothetical protein